MIAASIGITTAINALIFRNAQKNRISKTNERKYQWQFGSIRYTVSGTGRPLLLIHDIGLGCGLHEWYHNINALSKDYTVYALDLIGFGFSEKPGISYSPYLYTTLLNDFIKDIIREKTFVAASGHGAAFAVAAYSFMPEKYDKMILIAPTGIGTGNQPPTVYDVWLQRVLDAPLIGTSAYNLLNSKAGIRRYLTQYLYSEDYPVTEELAETYYAAAHDGGPNARYALSVYLSHFFNIDTERLLLNIDRPIHILWGADNPFNPVVNAEMLKNIDPDIQYTVFQNTKMLPHAERHRLFYSLCRDFFK